MISISTDFGVCLWIELSVLGEGTKDGEYGANGKNHCLVLFPGHGASLDDEHVDAQGCRCTIVLS